MQKNVQIKIKNVIDKNKKNVCTRNKKTLPLLSAVQLHAQCPRNGLQGNSDVIQFSFAETVVFRLAVKSSILCYSQVYFVAVILKVLLVHLLAALNFANVFKNKNVWKIKKR